MTTNKERLQGGDLIGVAPRDPRQYLDTDTITLYRVVQDEWTLRLEWVVSGSRADAIRHGWDSDVNSLIGWVDRPVVPEKIDPQEMASTLRDMARKIEALEPKQGE